MTDRKDKGTAKPPVGPGRPRDNELPDEKELDHDLSEIYSSEDGTPHEDMTRLEKAKGTFARKVLIWLIVFFGALAAVAWAGFFFFSPTNQKFTGERVQLQIDGPGAVKSGEQVEYVVKYKNGEGVALGTSSLDVRLPSNFSVSGTDPAAGSGHTWQIGSVGPGKSGEVHIKGVFLAKVQSQQDIQAILNYRPADFNSDFQRVATSSVLINGSVMQLKIDGPAKVLPGDAVTFTMTYTNTSPNDFSDVDIRAVYPEGFIPDSTDPKSEDDAMTEWRIPKVAGGGSGTITVKGTFASDAQGSLDLTGDIGFIDPSQNFVPQGNTDLPIDVLQGDLVTSLILNGKTSDQPVRFGDMLRYSVTYHNTGTSSLGNVRVAVTINPSPDGLVLWNKLKDDNGGVLNGNTITWDAKNVHALARIEGGGEGVIQFQVPVAAAPPPGAKDDLTITSDVQTSIQSIDGDVVDRTTKTQPMTAHLLSDTALTGDARYFDDNDVPLGSGPLPPQVGQATTYRITWHLKNSLHELTDLKLTTKLPSNVVYTGTSHADAGDLRYDAANDEMVWTLNWMPITVPELNVSFDVALTPTADQRDKIPTLVDATIFEATDKVATSTLLLSLPPMTTAVESDPYASGKGRVQ